ncbi:MAG: hypothetical protein ACRD6W_06450 [Nitrososphaerales archaeon]
MSTPGPEDDPAAQKVKRLTALRAEFVRQFGEKRGQELFRQLQAYTLNKVGPESWINVLDPKDIPDIFSTIWEKGLAGLGAAELLEIDNALSKTVAHRKVILRFLRYYLEDEEYAAVDTSFQLIGMLRDRSDHSPNRMRLIRALYDRLRRLRHGDRVRNQVSMGWLENVTYPEMRRLETKLASAGRAHGPDAEAVAQIFYRSLEPQPTKMWIRTRDDPAELFGEIAYKMLGGGRDIPYLDLLATSKAEAIRDAALEDFLASYQQFETERFDLGDAGTAVRIRRKTLP